MTTKLQLGAHCGERGADGDEKARTRRCGPRSHAAGGLFAAAAAAGAAAGAVSGAACFRGFVVRRGEAGGGERGEREKSENNAGFFHGMIF